jgi:hypothetical protein
VKKPKPDKDALGRKRRAERRLIEALKVEQDLDPTTGNHRMLAIIQRHLKALRKALKLSVNGAKGVTGVSRSGIVKFEKCDGRGNINTMVLLIFGYRVRVDLFFIGVWREYMGLAEG